MTLEGSVAIYLSTMQKKKRNPRCLPYRQLALENKAYHQSKLFGSRTHMACASKIYL